jgi:hypothetical protein
VSACAAAGAGFLLAVLWFDLMFDVQVRGHRGGELPASVLASIGGYYARVTTAARPMNRLIALVMAGTLASLIVEILDADGAPWRRWASLALAAGAIALAGARIVPRAVRLGAGADAIAIRSELARSIWRGHVACALAIALVLILQLTA